MKYLILLIISAQTLFGMERSQRACALEQLIEDKSFRELYLAALRNDKNLARSTKEFALSILADRFIHFGEIVAGENFGGLHVDLHSGNSLPEKVRHTSTAPVAETEEIPRSQLTKIIDPSRTYDSVSQLEAKETQKIIQNIVATMDQDFHLLADFLRAHFGLDGDTPKNLSEFARDFGLTRERARTLRNKALRRFFVFSELQRRDAGPLIKELWKFNPTPMETFESLFDSKGRRLRSMERLAEREDISLDSVLKMRTKAFEMLEIKLAYETPPGRKIFEELELKLPDEGQVVRLLYGLGVTQPRPTRKLARRTGRTTTEVNDDRKAFVKKYFYWLERWRLRHL